MSDLVEKITSLLFIIVFGLWVLSTIAVIITSILK